MLAETQTAPGTEEKLDRREIRTRQLIGEALIALLAEKGFESVTVQAITERAGINRATFYKHYVDKYDLVEKTIRRGFRQEMDKRMLNACHYTPENLKSLIVTVCEFTHLVNSHCKPAQAQFESLVETQVKAALYDLLLHWLEEEPVDIPHETAATAATWAIYGLALQWGHARQPEPVEKFAAEVLPLISQIVR